MAFRDEAERRGARSIELDGADTVESFLVRWRADPMTAAGVLISVAVHVVRHLSLPSADADDVAQEVAVRAWEKDAALLRRARGTGSIAAVLAGVSRNVLRERRRGLRERLLGDSDINVPSDDAGAEELCHGVEDEDSVPTVPGDPAAAPPLPAWADRERLARLTPGQRAVVERILAGESLELAADALGIDVPAAMARLRRAAGARAAKPPTGRPARLGGSVRTTDEVDYRRRLAQEAGRWAVGAIQEGVATDAADRALLRAAAQGVFAREIAARRGQSTNAVKMRLRRLRWRYRAASAAGATRPISDQRPTTSDRGLPRQCEKIVRRKLRPTPHTRNLHVTQR